MPRTRFGLGLILLALVALALAACGGGGGSETTASETTGGAETSAEATTEETPQASPEAGQAVLTSAQVSGVGTVLVDSGGLTVYTFGKDEGSTSSCYGECEKAWPPVLTEGEPGVGEGADASLLGTTKRKDGSVQVTYNGQPLYTFFEDKGPDEAKGNGSEAFGGLWWAIDESGSPVEGEGGEEGGGSPGGYSGY